MEPRSASPVAAATVASRAASAMLLRMRSLEARSSTMASRSPATGWRRSSGLIIWSERDLMKYCSIATSSASMPCTRASSRSSEACARFSRSCKAAALRGNPASSFSTVARST